MHARHSLPSLLLLLVMASFAGCGGLVGRKDLPPETSKTAPAGPEVPPQAEAILHTALSQVGRPYRFGGDSPRSGFDCSGLVHWSYAQNGVEIPRTTDALIILGREVERKSLGISDLVFFDVGDKDAHPGKDKEELHVALYCGEGRFVHAPSSGGAVREDRLEGPYWATRFLVARRILEEETSP